MSEPMVNRGIRLPLDMLAQIEDARHPGGMSGLIRDAVTEYFAKRGESDPKARDEAQRAIDTLSRILKFEGLI